MHLNSEERKHVMSRLIRLGVLAAGALASLAFTGSALASYAPSLTVTASKNAPGAQTSVLLGHVQSPADDPTFKDTIYAPLGYGVNLSQPAGTKIGDVSARLILRSGGNAEVDVNGRVVADNPANHPNDPCAPGVHGAVWNLNVTVAGTPLTVPIYVDAVTTGPEATFASAKIQFCLAGPIGTPAGAQLEFAFFDVNGVFTNPSNTADRIWHATFTPYVAGQPLPNPGGTTEGQAVVPGRVGLTMKTKSLKRGVVIVSGRLTVDGGAFGGALVELYKPGSDKRIGKARTKGNGKYSIRIKIKKKTRLIGQVLFLGDLTACPAPPLPGVPQGCKTASVSFFAVKIVTARRKK
jgi:hypothetical protein